MNLNMDPWRMSAEDHTNYGQQFAALHPLNGFLTGQQARDFFLRFGLPQTALAQIWNLADLNCDGRLDRREFCIAMHLIRAATSGFPLPTQLPETLKLEPATGMNFGTQAYSAPVRPTRQQSLGQIQGFGEVAPPMVPVSRSGFGVGQVVKKPDWSFPQQLKFKYSQEFNVIDKTKSSFLSGVQARNILTQSGLPNQILAQIWNLSDMDKDGRLSCDEYCLAMFLIDKLKSGEFTVLPDVLPQETLGGLLTRHRTTSIGPAADFGRKTPVAEDLLSGGPSDVNFPTTFEDKRRENYDRGQAELERRRQLLQEQERREREERQRKEREEAERRERERLEVERRRQAELERQLEVQRQEEARREEEYRKLAEQREVARRELERQRQMEMEKHRLHELIMQRQREQEATLQVKQRQKTLQLQLETLAGRSIELDSAVTDMRGHIVAITSAIEGMKRERDSKLADMELVRHKIQELNVESARCQLDVKSLKAQRDQSMQASNIEQTLQRLNEIIRQKSHNIENLRQSLDAVKADNEHRRMAHGDQAIQDDKRRTVEQSIRDEAELNRDLASKIAQRQVKLLSLRKPSVDNGLAAAAAGGGFVDNAWPTEVPLAAGAGAHHTTHKYRALYEFEARGEDELSFQPGDVLLVFEDHKGEPGWLAGQIKGKVGWFPEAFAEPMLSPSQSDSAGATPAETPSSPQHTFKLEPINEEPAVVVSEQRSDGEHVGIAGHETATTTNGTAPSGTTPVRTVAQFHWKGKKDDHLTFAKGDVVNVFEMHEMWWLGETLDGKRGWFPKSYVKISPDSADRRKSETVGKLKTSVSNDEFSKDVKTLTRKFESLEFPSQAPKQAERRYSQSSVASKSEADIAQEAGEWFRAVYPFPEMEPGDLQFDAGDDIFVVHKPTDTDWWTGVCNGLRGVFPANYVQPMPTEEARRKMSQASSVKQKSMDKTPSTESAQAASVASPTSPHHEACEVVKAIAPYKASGANQLSLETGDLIKIRSKSPTGWWEGELQRKAAETEKKVGWFPGNYVVPLDRKDSLRSAQSSRDSSCAGSVVATPGAGRKVQSPADSSSLFTVVAMFDYVAQQDDELSFFRGQVLRVLEKPDDDWWTGETLDGAKRGLFPATYVQQSEEQTIRII